MMYLADISLMQSDIGLLLTIATIIFAAGGLFNKLNVIEKKLDKYESLPERIKALETEVQNLKEAS